LGNTTEASLRPTRNLPSGLIQRRHANRVFKVLRDPHGQLALGNTNLWSRSG